MTAKLKGRMMNSGSIMISYQPLGMYPNFFRSIISNQAIQESDIDYMLSEMERLALETAAHSSSAPIGNLRLLSHSVSGGAGKPLAVGIGLSLQRSWGRGVVRL